MSKLAAVLAAVLAALVMPAAAIAQLEPPVREVLHGTVREGHTTVLRSKPLAAEAYVKVNVYVDGHELKSIEQGPLTEWAGDASVTVRLLIKSARAPLVVQVASFHGTHQLRITLGWR